VAPTPADDRPELDLATQLARGELWAAIERYAAGQSDAASDGELGRITDAITKAIHELERLARLTPARSH
jgi:hypothetical protein